MKEFRGKVAVVTGAASGIGRALAERCAGEGMRVVLADVDEAGLAEAERELKEAGAEAVAVRTDVSKAGEVEALAQRTLDAFGAAHLLFNNVGVGAGTTVWESTQADWEWVLGVNLWGVIHGVRTFVPLMLGQGDECHVVNTASMAGLISGPALGVYKVAKHGVVALSETLCCELALMKSNVGVSVLCPGGVNTRIMDSERNRPAELRNDSAVGSAHPAVAQAEAMLHRIVGAGMPPSEVAAMVFDAIRDGRFYILTHEDWKTHVLKRMGDIVHGRNPC
ncbi:MAG TPA: SDR family NAD(P)-dependent oxidoreductase [Pyrinomonadaceae bacterium]|nr:SDR family NAD(P)-dependent oxidoreductase [Pyrinomonadaceae bacterium]